MKARGPIVHGLLLIACAAALFPSIGRAATTSKAPATKAPATAKTTATSKPPAPAKAPATKAPATKTPASVDIEPPGGWLPQSALLAQIDTRTITVKKFVDGYFDAYGEDKPGRDSLGRTQFLQSMVNKDVLGLTALAINRPLDFEDRATLREYANSVYSNLLYQREVLEKVRVTDEQVLACYEYFKAKLHARRILVPEITTAQALRRDLIAGRITWSNAVRKYSISPDRDQDGDLGWSDPTSLSMPVAIKVYPLRPGEISEPIPQIQGYLLIQVIERKAVDPPAWVGMQSYIRGQLSEMESSRLADSLTSLMAREINLRVDSVNVAWAASQFGAAQTSSSEGGRPVITVDANVPDFTPADTARVLARYKDGQLSMGDFLHSYTAITPMMRPNVNDFFLLKSQVISTALNPYMSQLAIRRGLDKDSVAVQAVGERREKMLVEHLYSDSIESKIWVKPEERKKYFEDNKTGFRTYARVTYATVVRASRAGIDSVVARLKAGETARDIQLADSLVGIVNMGSYSERLESDHGTPYYKVLFEELRPGQWTVDGPDKTGRFAVIQLLARQESRPLTYQEASQYADDAVRNTKAEERLKAFLAREAKKHKVESHPELLMRVHLVPND